MGLSGVQRRLQRGSHSSMDWHVLFLALVCSPARAEEPPALDLEARSPEMQGQLEVQRQEIATLKAKQAERKQLQFMTGGEVVELVSKADIRALTERIEACEAKTAFQEDEITRIEAAVKQMQPQRT